MKVRLNEKSFTVSITGLTIEQFEIIRYCVEQIKSHTYFDESMQKECIDGCSIAGCFDEEDYETLKNLNLNP